MASRGRRFDEAHDVVRCTSRAQACHEDAVERCVTPYRLPLPPHRPIRRRRRRFRVAWLAAWQSLSCSITTYSFVAAWVVHAALMAMLLRFEMPSGELCGCGSWWDEAAWFHVLRTATSP